MAAQEGVAPPRFRTIQVWPNDLLSVLQQIDCARVNCVNRRSAESTKSTESTLFLRGCGWRPLVEFKNVGHLPASQAKLRFELTCNDNGEWSPPPVDDKDLRPAGIFPIGTSVTRGSHGIGVPQPWTKYLYAWGRVTYVDGFGNERFTNFCHRYNTEVRETQTGGGCRIRKETGRHHEYGNDAN